MKRVKGTVNPLTLNFEDFFFLIFADVVDLGDDLIGEILDLLEGPVLLVLAHTIGILTNAFASPP